MKITLPFEYGGVPWDWQAGINITLEDGHTEEVFEVTRSNMAETFGYATTPEMGRAFAASPQLLLAVTALLSLVDDHADEIVAIVHPDTINAAIDGAMEALRAAGATVEI